MPVTRQSPVPVVTVCALLAVSAAALWLSGPPQPGGDMTADAEFSAARAMPYVRTLAVGPHPMGSPEHARVRVQLVEALSRMGFEVEHHRATGLRVRGPLRARGTIVAGLVENILVRLKGQSSTGAVLLAGHYDSVAAGPGGADDTSAVAALLETLRALKTGPALRNDVIVLFTDGEEDSMLGAEAFVSRHPWARDVRVVLNFEARGNTGASMMFETSPGNGPVVAAWASHIPKPAGTSLGYEVYKRLPNDTDFTEFKRMNAVGLNFAFIGNVDVYHTPRDTPEALNVGSLQAHGESALGLARHFGNVDLDLKALRGADAVFFSMPGRLVVRYSSLWVWPIAAAGWILWLVVVVVSRRNGDISVGGLLLAFFLTAGVMAATGWLAWRVPDGLAWLQARLIPLGDPSTSVAQTLALTAAALAIWTVFYAVARVRFAAQTLALAGSALVLLGGTALAYAMPGASYLAAWPAIAGLVAALFLPRASGKGSMPALRATGIVCCSLPAVAVLVPTGGLLQTALSLGPEGAAGLAILVGLGVCALGACVDVMLGARRWYVPVALLVVACCSVAAGVVTSAFDEDHPRPENVVYVLDAQAGKAVWATAGGLSPLTPWLEQYVSAFPERGSLPGLGSVLSAGPYQYKAAPVIDAQGPEAILRDSHSDGGGRVLTVTIRSPRNARCVSVRMPEREVFDTLVNGRRPGGGPSQGAWAPGSWGLEFVNVPPEGITVVVTVRGHDPVTFVVADRSDGLPVVPGVGLLQRPASSMPIHRGDALVVHRAFTF